LPALAPALCIEFVHYFDLAYDGAAWPAQDTLAAALGVRREAVNKVINALVEQGHLTSTRQGRDKPNVYRMVLREDASRCAQSRTSSPPKMCAQDVRDSEFRCAQKRTRISSKTPETANAVSQEREREEESLTRFDHTLGEPEAAALRAAGSPEEEDHGAVEIIPPPRVPSLNHERAWRELRTIWVRPHPEDQRADRRAFDEACREVAPEIMVAAAPAWVAAYEPRYLPPLWKWIIDRGYEKDPPVKCAKHTKRSRSKSRPVNGRSNAKPDMMAVMCEIGGWTPNADGSLTDPDTGNVWGLQ
jgi:hypothetical protein